MAFVDEKLEELKKISAQVSSHEYAEAVENKNFDELFISAIQDDNVKTIVMEYQSNVQQLKLQIIKDHLKVSSYKVYYFSMPEQTYMNFCGKTLSLDTNAKFNDSANVTIEGRVSRVFAIMPPYKDKPLIVISTVKNPPESLGTLDKRQEEILARIINEGNVLIAGKSGSGKTYLLNYLLNKYMGKEKRIGVIQEFMEIISPNDFTDQLCVPPHKPDQTYCDLEFLTEESNLMRYDLVIVGEVKGKEAWPFVSNCASGTKGITTMHGVDPDSCLRRLKTLCMLSQTNLDENVVSDFIAKAIQYVVLVDDAQVKQIKKVGMSTQRGTFQLEDLLE